MEAQSSVNWRQLREFKAVDLSGSYVLSWAMEYDTLQIDADILLLPEHSSYETPRPTEKLCIRPALLEFPYCASVRIAGADDDVTSKYVVKNLKAGKVSELFACDGVYTLSGQFGTVVIEAERPLLRLKRS